MNILKVSSVIVLHMIEKFNYQPLINASKRKVSRCSSQLIKSIATAFSFQLPEYFALPDDHKAIYKYSNR